MPSRADILNWLIETIARETDRPANSIDPDKSVHTLGIDSALVISLTFDLEDRFGVELNATALFEQKSLRAFSEQLARHLDERPASS